MTDLLKNALIEIRKKIIGFGLHPYTNEVMPILEFDQECKMVKAISVSTSLLGLINQHFVCEHFVCEQYVLFKDNKNLYNLLSEPDTIIEYYNQVKGVAI
jgi:hypothetical protein